MQLFIDDDPKKRFDDYLDKTFRKTASLIANSCKAVSFLYSFCLISHKKANKRGREVGEGASAPLIVLHSALQSSIFLLTLIASFCLNFRLQF